MGKCPLKFRGDLMKGKVLSALACYDNKIMARQLPAATPEQFPQEPFYPIADHRLPHRAADRHAKSAPARLIGSVDHREVRSLNFPASAGQAQEFGSFGEARPLGKPIPPLT